MAEQKKSKGLHIGLWVVQVLVGGMFLMVGFMKTVTPVPDLIKTGMTWVEWSPLLPRIAGISEVLGGLGLILPSLLRIKPNLTVTAAYCLVLVMVLAVIVHFVTNDAKNSPTPIVLGALSYFIAWGRSKKYPIQPK